MVGYDSLPACSNSSLGFEGRIDKLRAVGVRREADCQDECFGLFSLKPCSFQRMQVGEHGPIGLMRQVYFRAPSLDLYEAFKIVTVLCYLVLGYKLETLPFLLSRYLGFDV